MSVNSRDGSSTTGTALITGASSGIGAALARELASRNFDLIITARREANLKQLADELGTYVTVDVVVNDLFANGGAATLIDAVEYLGRPVDVLVNNAGLATAGNFHELDSSQVENLLSLNMRAVTLFTHHYLPLMIQRGAGRILNVASFAAFQPIPGMSLYAATKAFVLSLSEAASEEIQGTGVTITALCPGITREETSDSRGLMDLVISRPEDVAKEGVEALMAGEVIKVPGLANQAVAAWSRYSPRWAVRGIGGALSRLKPGDYKTG